MHDKIFYRLTILESTLSRSCFSYLRLLTVASSWTRVSENFCSINLSSSGSSDAAIASFRVSDCWASFLESIFLSVPLAEEIWLASSLPISFRISVIELDARDMHCVVSFWLINLVDPCKRWGEWLVLFIWFSRVVFLWLFFFVVVADYDCWFCFFIFHTI